MLLMNLKPTIAVVLALSTFTTLATANTHHRSHIHRRADMQRRAGAAFNGTDVLTGSLEIGHQASQAAAAAASSSSAAVAGTTVADVDSDTVAGQTSVAVVSTSALPDATSTVAATPTSDTAAVVTSTQIASSAALASSSSSIVEETTSSIVSSASVLPVSIATSTSTAIVNPVYSTIQSTVTPAQDLLTRASSTAVRSSASASSTASAGAAAANSGGSSNKLSVGKTAMIVIIVVASVIVGALAIWTIIRKWKLGPSKKFDERMQPLDFSPHGGLPDPFLEKTRRNRYSNSSVSSADRQRRQFVSELDAAEQEKYAYDTQPNYLHGVPSHDFTPAPTTGGIASSNYGAVADYDPYGYPPGGQGQQHDYSAHADETVGGNGYADLRRGPSTVGTNFAGMGAGPGGLQSAAPPVPPMPQQYGGAQDMGYEREETLYSDNPNNLGRPTQGEGPYFAASQAGHGQRY